MGEIDDQTIQQTLQKLWKKVLGRKKLPVVLSIPRLLVTSRRLRNLPATITDDQLPSLVAIQAETELPFTPEHAVYDFHDVRRDEESGVSVELIATRREAAQKQIDYLKPLGILPRALLPSSLAICVLAGMQLNENSSDRRIMVVDIGASRTDLCVMQENILQFSRSFPVGGDLLTRYYQDETSDDFESAENKKIANAELDERSESSTPTYVWAGEFITELRRSIGAAKRELDLTEGDLVREIWLCGGGAQIAGLPTYVATQLQIPARLWNPLDALKSSISDQSLGNWDGLLSNLQSIEGFSSSSAVSLGLGVNALSQQIELDLLPKEEKAKLTQAERKSQMLKGVAAGAVLLFGLVLGGLTCRASYQSKIYDLDSEIRSIGGAESSAKRALVKDLAIADLLAPRSSPLDIFRELSVRFADRTKIAWTNLNISHLDEPDKAKIVFSVEASSHQEVSKMLSAMAQSGLFREIKSGQITSIERDKKQISQVQVTCNLSLEAVRMFAQARYLHPIGAQIEPEETDIGPEAEEVESVSTQDDNDDK
jgi:type IV pilus assembly protein PilM